MKLSTKNLRENHIRKFSLDFLYTFLSDIMIKTSLSFYIARRKLIFLILPDCKVVVIFLFKLLKKLIYGVFEVLVVLLCFTHIYHIYERNHIFLIVRRFVPDIAYKCRIVQSFSLYPEILAALTAF